VKLRVVLGEDNYLAREAIVSVLERAEDIELVATSRDFDSLLEVIARERPDVVLTDIRMPPTNTDEGIRLATELRQSSPDLAVVVFSQHNEPYYATALFDAGSGGRAYLLKDRIGDAGELLRALHVVAEGGSVVDPAVVERLLQSHRAREQSQLRSLTPREFEILALIAEGRSNAAIAEVLVLTKRAVERHINSIFMKLKLGETRDVSRRVKAALIYLTERGG
jgi:DNA-binding NarL/FixJ family response regulator